MRLRDSLQNSGGCTYFLISALKHAPCERAERQHLRNELRAAVDTAARDVPHDETEDIEHAHGLACERHVVALDKGTKCFRDHGPFVAVHNGNALTSCGVMCDFGTVGEGEGQGAIPS